MALSTCIFPLPIASSCADPYECSVNFCSEFEFSKSYLSHDRVIFRPRILSGTVFGTLHTVCVMRSQPRFSFLVCVAPPVFIQLSVSIAAAFEVG
eukprot:g57472.t1